MICYLDSSVVLRKLLKQSQTLAAWSQIQMAISSRLLRVECYRVIDRLRLSSALTNDEVVEGRAGLYALLQHTRLLPVTEHILRHTEQSLMVPLATLDCLHLVSALAWRELHGSDFVFATHDRELGDAAKAHGFKVIGV